MHWIVGGHQSFLWRHWHIPVMDFWQGLPWISKSRIDLLTCVIRLLTLFPLTEKPSHLSKWNSYISFSISSNKKTNAHPYHHFQVQFRAILDSDINCSELSFLFVDKMNETCRKKERCQATVDPKKSSEITYCLVIKSKMAVIDLYLKQCT